MMIYPSASVSRKNSKISAGMGVSLASPTVSAIQRNADSAVIANNGMRWRHGFAAGGGLPLRL